MLTGDEIDRLRRSAHSEGGLLRIQDAIGHDDGDMDAAQWNVYPQFDSMSPVVAIDTRDASWAWEADIPKRVLQLLRGGCEKLGDSTPN